MNKRFATGFVTLLVNGAREAARTTLPCHMYTLKDPNSFQPRTARRGCNEKRRHYPDAWAPGRTLETYGKNQYG